MDGKGAWHDNLFVELWRSVKYEEVYRRAYDSVSHPRPRIARPVLLVLQLKAHVPEYLEYVDLGVADSAPAITG